VCKDNCSGYLLEFAKELGATHTINTKNEDAATKIKELTGGLCVDYSVECSGNGKAMETAFESLHDKGIAVIAGNLAKGEKISIDPFDLIKGKKIFGTWGGETNLDKDIPLYAKMYLAGKLKLDKLITQKYGLGEINNAFAELENGEIIRGLIKF